LKEETIMGVVPDGRRTGSENHHRGWMYLQTINGTDRNRAWKRKEERGKIFSEGSTEDDE
jgi:hypothetical protein